MEDVSIGVAALANAWALCPLGTACCSGIAPVCGAAAITVSALAVEVGVPATGGCTVASWGGCPPVGSVWATKDAAEGVGVASIAIDDGNCTGFEESVPCCNSLGTSSNKGCTPPEH